MSYLARYGEAMDYVREEFHLPISVSMYEAVVTVTEAYKVIKEKEILTSLKGEEECLQTEPLPQIRQKLEKNNNSLKSQKSPKKKGRPKKK